MKYKTMTEMNNAQREQVMAEYRRILSDKLYEIAKDLDTEYWSIERRYRLNKDDIDELENIKSEALWELANDLECRAESLKTETDYRI